MTENELAKLRGLKKEIQRDCEKLEELKAKATSSSPNISGLPNVHGITDKVGKYSSEIADLQNKITLKIEESYKEIARLTEYINTVNDPTMRTILTLRFMDGLTWRRVAQSLGMYTEDGVRVVCKRFISKRN